MQPYEQVLASLPSKYNEPYTKPCHDRYQQLDAMHHLAFPCTVFYHKKPVISINLLSLGKLLLLGMIFR